MNAGHEKKSRNCSGYQQLQWTVNIGENQYKYPSRSRISGRNSEGVSHLLSAAAWDPWLIVAHILLPKQLIFGAKSPIAKRFDDGGRKFTAEAAGWVRFSLASAATGWCVIAFHCQITSLSQAVKLLIHFIESYDSLGFSRETIQVLESRIATAAHAAHDVIESHVVDQIHSGTTLPGKNAKVSYFLLDLQKSIEDMEFIKAKATQVRAKRRLREDEPTYSSEPLPSRKNVMVGFEAVSFQLMDMFVGGSADQRVIPIVGMGGIGKTALATYVCENSLITQHFDVLLWATISQDYSVEHILKELLSGQRNSTISGDVGELGEKLHKKLWGRRYLVVLDDMWSLNAWEKVKMFLPDDGSGSCVIVTTRLSTLSSLLSSSPFEMKFLDEDKSWELFCGNVFGDEECPVELEEIGRKIVKRCGGLPLSIVVIGGHMRRSSREIEYWEKVANLMSPISSIGEEEQCLEILSLSYQHLPACLKPCFLYMGIFKEDEPINASEVLQYWIAEGFIKPKDGLSLEEVGEDFLRDLISRNLVLARTRRWDGQAEVCGVHDTVRELCLRVGKKEKFLSMLDDATTTQGIQRERLIIIPGGKKLTSNMIGALKSAPLLRSLICHGGRLFSDELWVNFRLLRVSSNVNDIHLKKDGARLPRAHFQQVNLRFLSFDLVSAESVHSIPSSISACWNLQTFIMNNFDGQMVDLPYQISEMPRLRHLQSYRVYLPDPVEVLKQQESIVLQNLHTVKGVMNLSLTEEVCKRMPNMEELAIRLWYGTSCEDYCFHNLDRFSKLKSLRCELPDGDWRDVVRSFSFPSSLELLSIRNSCLDWEDLTMVMKSLPRLAFLQVSVVNGSEWSLDEEEEFRCLKFLEINNCGDLAYLNVSSSHFPVLETLRIWTVHKLDEIPLEIGEIATLRRVHLFDCSMNAAVSAMRMVVEQESFGNMDIQLHVSFWESEEAERLKMLLEDEGLTSDCLHLMKF